MLLFKESIIVTRSIAPITWIHPCNRSTRPKESINSKGNQLEDLENFANTKLSVSASQQRSPFLKTRIPCNPLAKRPRRQSSASATNRDRSIQPAKPSPGWQEILNTEEGRLQIEDRDFARAWKFSCVTRGSSYRARNTSSTRGQAVASSCLPMLDVRAWDSARGDEGRQRHD